MATIYRFIVEQRTQQGGDGRKNKDGSTSKKTTAKKGRMVSIFGGEKGGVEHNRKMRAINPLINKWTGGAWEKGMRVGRAGLGLVTRDTETGKLGISGPAIAIIIAFVIQLVMKIQKAEIEKAQKLNAQNFKQLENGIGAINGQFEVTTNWFNGRQTYNQNK